MTYSSSRLFVGKAPRATAWKRNPDGTLPEVFPKLGQVRIGVVLPCRIPHTTFWNEFALFALGFLVGIALYVVVINGLALGML